MTYILICIFLVNGQALSGFSAEFDGAGACTEAKQRIKSEAEADVVAFCMPKG